MASYSRCSREVLGEGEEGGGKGKEGREEAMKEEEGEEREEKGESRKKNHHRSPIPPAFYCLHSTVCGDSLTFLTAL